jgi:hypothetical protein
MAVAIDTGKVTERRKLHFDSLDDILAEVDRLGRSREIRTLGNLTAGQIVKHLATVMNRSIDGFSTGLPSVVRTMLRLFLKRKILIQPMSPGFKLPAKAQADLIPGPTSLDQALADIRGAIKRLQTEPGRVQSPFLGPLTRDEWNQLHCRHCELHLSFLVPVD